MTRKVLNDINTVITDLDLLLANSDTTDLEELKSILFEIAKDVRQPYEKEYMYDIDISDYTITLHHYVNPNYIPAKAILIGKSYYMYSQVEIAEPTFLGVHSIVKVFDNNYRPQYAIVV